MIGILNCNTQILKWIKIISRNKGRKVSSDDYTSYNQESHFHSNYIYNQATNHNHSKSYQNFLQEKSELIQYSKKQSRFSFKNLMLFLSFQESGQHYLCNFFQDVDFYNISLWLEINEEMGEQGRMTSFIDIKVFCRQKAHSISLSDSPWLEQSRVFVRKRVIFFHPNLNLLFPQFIFTYLLY